MLMRLVPGILCGALGQLSERDLDTVVSRALADTKPSNRMTLEGRDIVCVGFSDWNADVLTNQQHLLTRAADRNRILFVESLGLRRRSWRAATCDASPDGSSAG